MISPYCLPLSPGSHDHAWCYFHFNPFGKFPEDGERENANLKVYSTSCSFVIHTEWICASSQISPQPGQGPTLCLKSVFSLVAFSGQSPGEGLHLSKLQTSQHLLRARESLQEKTTVKQGCNYLKLKAVTWLTLCSAHHSLRTHWDSLPFTCSIPVTKLFKRKCMAPNFKIFFPTYSTAD